MVLIDGNNLFYKSFFVTKWKSLDAVKRMFLTLVRTSSVGCANIKIVWDSSSGYWRYKLYPSYKEGRTPFCDDNVKDDFYKWRTAIIKWMRGDFSYRQLQLDGFEADDIIAEMVRNRSGVNTIIVIVSSDKDFYQLLSLSKPTVMIRRVGHSSKALYSAIDFADEFGIEPFLWSDVKTLCGDKSDNISGVNGVGIKRALEIIKKYGRVSSWIDSELVDDGSVVFKWASKAKIDFEKLKMYYNLIDLSENRSGKTISIGSNILK